MLYEVITLPSKAELDAFRGDITRHTLLHENFRRFFEALPKDARKRYDTLQWLMFQMGHVGPMFGQANHFNNYARDTIQYAKDRYNNESVRLYRVLDNRLSYNFV